MGFKNPIFNIFYIFGIKTNLNYCINNNIKSEINGDECYCMTIYLIRNINSNL